MPKYTTRERIREMNHGVENEERESHKRYVPVMPSRTEKAEEARKLREYLEEPSPTGTIKNHELVEMLYRIKEGMPDTLALFDEDEIALINNAADVSKGDWDLSRFYVSEPISHHESYHKFSAQLLQFLIREKDAGTLALLRDPAAIEIAARREIDRKRRAALKAQSVMMAKFFTNIVSATDNSTAKAVVDVDREKARLSVELRPANGYYGGGITIIIHPVNDSAKPGSKVTKKTQFKIWWDSERGRYYDGPDTAEQLVGSINDVGNALEKVLRTQYPPVPQSALKTNVSPTKTVNVPPTKTVVDSAAQDKIRILNVLEEKSSRSDVKALAGLIRGLYESGQKPDDEQLKRIRNYLYMTGMRPQADHFRVATLARKTASAEAVARRWVSNVLI